MDKERTIAKTANIEIIEREHNGHKYYIFSLYNGKYTNKFYNKHDAFKAAYDELTALPFC